MKNTVAKVVAIFLLVSVVLGFLMATRTSDAVDADNLPTISAPYEEELIDPSEWFVTDTGPSQFEDETYPPETQPTEPETEPETEPTEPVTGHWESLGIFTLTAYCPCYDCSKEWGSMTATEVVAQPNHTIAVDPTVIPYGSKILIGDIVYIAEDCGSSVKNEIVDIFFTTHEEVEAFGMRTSEIFIWIE